METLTTKDVAAELDTDPRTLRKFLRSEVEQAGGMVGENTPGKGGRWGFERKELRDLRRRFARWTAEHVRSEPSDNEISADEAE